MKDVHELCQFALLKLASCTSCLNLLERNLQNHHTEDVQSSANLETLEKRVAMTEDVLVHAGLWEIRTELQGMNEKIVIVRGKWEEATIKL